MSPRTKSDIFLVLIVVAVVGLVIAAFIIVANRPEPQFEEADTAESAVHDYLLALQMGDYERAYSYLSPQLGYPASFDDFYESIQNYPWEFAPSENYSLIVESSTPAGEGRAEVTVRQISGASSLFGGSGASYDFSMLVEEGSEGWRIVDGQSFWSSCWGDENSCPDGELRFP